MQNNIGGNRIEQDAEADQLAVMLFANVGLWCNKKGLRSGKKARQRAQAA